MLRTEKLQLSQFLATKQRPANLSSFVLFCFCPNASGVFEPQMGKSSSLSTSAETHLSQDKPTFWLCLSTSEDTSCSHKKFLPFWKVRYCLSFPPQTALYLLGKHFPTQANSRFQKQCLHPFKHPTSPPCVVLHATMATFTEKAN